MNSCLVEVWKIIYLEVSFRILSPVGNVNSFLIVECPLYSHFLTYSVYCFLTGSSYFQPLSWNLRMKVALGAAKGLAYLHSPEAKVIYRDFKSSNILLDSVCGTT